MALEIVPMTLREANAFVEQKHRLDTEPGTSLKAAGWKCVGQAGGLRWTGKRRPQVDLYPAQMKIRWEIGTEDGEKEKALTMVAAIVKAVPKDVI